MSCLASLARAVGVTSMCCFLLHGELLADDLLAINDGWAFPRAAMELQRLPPTTVDNTQLAASATTEDSTIQPASLPVTSSSHFADPWDDLGTRLYVGYDRGFLIAADQSRGNDVASVDFLMRVNSWLQLRQSHFESDGPNADQNTFSFERLRLSFAGHVLSPDLQYFFQFDGNSDRETRSIFLDYFATYDIGRGRFGFEADRLGFKFGKWKVPFSRSREESGRRLQFTDRAMANVFFDLNRSFGVAVTSQLGATDGLGPAAGPFEIEAAIFNGFRTGSVSTNRSDALTGLDRNFGWSMRGHTDMFSELGSDGEPDLSWHCSPTIRIGGGLAFTRVDAEGPTEFTRQRVVDSGATLASILPVGVTAYDVWLYTIDAHFKYHGLSVIGEYYWRYMTQFSGAAVPTLLDDGLVLQTGYFVIPEKFELIARWSRIAGDSGTLGLANENSDEFGAGFVWYFKGQNAKLTFDASRFNGAPVSSSRLDLLPGDAGWLFRTQVQLAF